MSDQSQSMFDAALRDEPVVTEPAPAEPSTATPDPEVSGQPRDEHGRFATKGPDTAQQPALVAEPPAASPPAALPAKTEEGATIPAWRLAEVTQERNELRQRLARFEAAQAAKPAEPEKPKPEIWEDPDAFVKGAVSPIEERLSKHNERISQRLAVITHGREVAEAAYVAFGKAIQSGDPNARAEYERIKASDDPYEDIVQWHKRNETLQKVGNDPNAWFEQELARRMADPAFAAKMAAPQPQPAPAAPAGQPQPSNVIDLPPSLSRIGSAPVPDAQGSMSSESLFRSAVS